MTDEDIVSFDKELRLGAYGAAIVVLCVNKFLGGSWLGFVLGIAVVDFAYRVLRFAFSDTLTGQSKLWPFESLPGFVRLTLSILLVGMVAALDLYFGGFSLGRSFNLYLIPIFVSSLLFGERIAIATLFASFLVVYYLAIPPRYSFSFLDISDCLRLLIFLGLAIIVSFIPKILSLSVEMNIGLQKRNGWR